MTLIPLISRRAGNLRCRLAPSTAPARATFKSPLNSDVSCTEDSFVATVCDYDASGDAGSSAAVIGTVTGVSLFAILAVAAGFIFLRRRRSKGSDNGDSGAHAAEEREMVAILSSDGTVSGDGIHSRSGQAAKLADAI
eukprot:PLAT9455.1.p2 GENE.PLAT9455.1~~PLAT9455.1.p2  ORF type:complete len:138 (+),score=44.47 PLAT9455.1:1095-1508(+)